MAQMIGKRPNSLPPARPAPLSLSLSMYFTTGARVQGYKVVRCSLSAYHDMCIKSHKIEVGTYLTLPR